MGVYVRDELRGEPEVQSGRDRCCATSRQRVDLEAWAVPGVYKRPGHVRCQPVNWKIDPSRNVGIDSLEIAVGPEVVHIKLPSAGNAQVGRSKPPFERRDKNGGDVALGI